MFDELNIPWPLEVKSVTSTSGLFLLDSGSLGMACVVGHKGTAGYIGRCILCFMVPPVFMLMHFCSFALGEKKWLLDKTLNSVGQVYQGIFIGIVITAVMPMQCFGHPNGQKSIVAYPMILCGDPDHTTLVALSSILFILLIVPFTALEFWVSCVAHGQSSKDPNFCVRFRFFLYRFRPDRWWWAPVLHVRQILLAFAPIVQVEDPGAQILYVSAILISYQTMLGRYWPWKASEINGLDAVSGVLLSVLIVAVGSFLPESPWTIGHTALMLTLLTALGVFVAISAGYVVWNLMKGGSNAELGKNITPWRKTGLEVCNGFIGLVQELNEYEPESLKGLFHNVNEYDLQAFRHVQSFISTNSHGVFRVNQKATLKRICSSHGNLLALTKKQANPSAPSQAAQQNAPICGTPGALNGNTVFTEYDDLVVV
jgi:hypothetical protein